VVIPPKPIINDTTETETNGTQDGDEHGTKRARISLKIKKPEIETQAAEEVADKPETVTEVPAEEVEVKEEPKTERALSKEVRDAFAKVVVA
jgi:ethanolamine utilization cobalamin adenosyltransferase